MIPFLRIHYTRAIGDDKEKSKQKFNWILLSMSIELERHATGAALWFHNNFIVDASSIWLGKQHISFRINYSLESKFFHLQRQRRIKFIFVAGMIQHFRVYHIWFVSNKQKNWHIKCWKKTMYHWIPYQTMPSTYIRCIHIEFTAVFIWFVISCFPLFAVAVGFLMGSISHKNWCRFDSAYSWRLFQISWLI